MDNKAFAKAILMDCPNIFSYFQSLIEHPLFLSAVAKAYHEQWFWEFERFLILQGKVQSGKTTFGKFLKLIDDSSGNTLDISLSDFMVSPEEMLTGNYNRPLFVAPAIPKAVNIYVDGFISPKFRDILKLIGTHEYIYSKAGNVKAPLLILHTQRRLTEIESSEGLARRQLLLNFQPIARPIHNYLEHQQISYEIPAFLNCLASMTKDDCLEILNTADRSQLTAK